MDCVVLLQTVRLPRAHQLCASNRAGTRTHDRLLRPMQGSSDACLSWVATLYNGVEGPRPLESKHSALSNTSEADGMQPINMVSIANGGMVGRNLRPDLPVVPSTCKCEAIRIGFRFMLT